MSDKDCEHHFILEQFGATCEKCGLYLDSDDIITRCDYFDFYKREFTNNLNAFLKWSHVAEELFKEYESALEKLNLVCWEDVYENSPAIISYKILKGE